MAKKKEVKVQEEVKAAKATKVSKGTKAPKAPKEVKSANAEKPANAETPKCEGPANTEDPKCECLSLTKVEALQRFRLHRLSVEVDAFIASLVSEIKGQCVAIAEEKVDVLSRMNDFCETERDKEIFGEIIEGLTDKLSTLSLYEALLESVADPSVFSVAKIEKISVADDPDDSDEKPEK